MSVTVSKTLDFNKKVIDALKIETSVAKKLEDNGITVSQGVNKLKFTSKEGVALVNLNAADGAVVLAMKGAIGKTSLNHLKASFESAANEAIDKVPHGKTYNDDDVSFEEPSHVGHEVEKSPDILQEALTKVMKPAVMPDYSNFKVEVMNEAEMANASTIKLKDAEKLYQPVVGTSAGSRYFVIALSPDLKIAARYKSNELSIRAEGDIESHKQLLKDNQFNIGGNGAYASLHVKAPELILARRVIGAVITGLGLPVASPVPMFDMLVGKGA